MSLRFLRSLAALQLRGLDLMNGHGSTREVDQGVNMHGSNQTREITDPTQHSVLDLLDNLLNRGVLLDGTLVLGVADVDLVYLRINALLSAVDRNGKPELP